MLFGTATVSEELALDSISSSLVDYEEKSHP
jgi:hypothetical protein